MHVLPTLMYDWKSTYLSYIPPKIVTGFFMRSNFPTNDVATAIFPVNVGHAVKLFASTALLMVKVPLVEQTERISDDKDQ